MWPNLSVYKVNFYSYHNAGDLRYVNHGILLAPFGAVIRFEALPTNKGAPEETAMTFFLCLAVSMA